MIRLSLIFFVVFSSNIFCVKIRILQGLFTTNNNMLMYSPNYSKYQQANKDYLSALEALDKANKGGKMSNNELKDSKDKVFSVFQRQVYSFDFKSEGARVRDLLDFFLKKYGAGETSSKIHGLVDPSNSGFDVANYKFEKLSVKEDNGNIKTYRGVNDVVDIKEDCVVVISFSKKSKGPSGPSGSGGKKSSGGCSCKNGKN